MKYGILAMLLGTQMCLASVLELSFGQLWHGYSQNNPELIGFAERKKALDLEAQAQTTLSPVEMEIGSSNLGMGELEVMFNQGFVRSEQVEKSKKVILLDKQDLDLQKVLRHKEIKKKFAKVYIGAVLLQERQKTLDSLLLWTQSTNQWSKRAFSTGVISRLDLMRLKLAEKDLTFQKEQNSHQFKRLVEYLVSASKDSNSKINLSQTNPRDIVLKFDVKSLLNQPLNIIEANSLAIKSLEWNKAKLEALNELENTPLIGEWKLGTGFARDMESGAGTFKLNVGLNLDVFSPKKNLIKANNLRIQAESSQKSALVQKEKLEINDLLKQVRWLKKEIEFIDKELIPASQEVIQTMHDFMKRGVVDYPDYQNARSEYINYQEKRMEFIAELTALYLELNDFTEEEFYEIK